MMEYERTEKESPRTEFDEVIRKYLARKSERAPIIAEMDEVRRAYNGDLVVPLPELDRDEAAAVANKLRQGVDQTAMRCASVTPNVSYPALRPGIKKSEKAAADRRSATFGWWNRAAMNLKDRRRARHILGYGASPVVIKPHSITDDANYSRVIPWWEVRNPLGAFPAPCSDPDDLTPPDVIFAYTRGRDWLEARYPEEMRRLRKLDGTRTFEMLEYVCDDEIVIGVMGDKDNGNGGYGQSGGAEWEVLCVAKNRAEMPLCVMPGRITLDRIMGQYGEMIGMYRWEAKIMSLSLIGTERSIFPDQYLVVPQGGQGEVVVPADGPRGVVGVVEGGSLVNAAPGVGPYAAQAMAQLEANQRSTGSVPTEFGGRAGSGVRTGRRGEQVLSEAVDYPIQEIQELMERSKEAEHRIAIATAKAYEKRPVSFHVPGRGQVTYTPETFESSVNFVRYAYTGADANGLTIQIGQKLGLETLSRETAMELDPLVQDVETERDRILAEKVGTAFWSSVQAMAADPNSPITPLDLANLARLIVSDKKDQYEAFEQVHKDAQARQEAKMQADAAAAQGPPGAMPGMEAMPGIQGPASASPEAAPSIGPPAQGISNLSTLMTQLRRPNMPLASEMNAGV